MPIILRKKKYFISHLYSCEPFHILQKHKNRYSLLYSRNRRRKKAKLFCCRWTHFTLVPSAHSHNSCLSPTLLLSVWQLEVFPKLKGVWHEIFELRFFSWISVPQAYKYSIGAVLNFFENSRRYSRITVYRRCKRHRWKDVQRCQRQRRKIYRQCQWHRRI